MTTLEAIYARVPEVTCKGLCLTACGPIGYSAAEADAIRDNGYNEPMTRDHRTHGPLTCSHLTERGRCDIYELRPLVCRLFGAVKAMACPHGCKPKGGYLTDRYAQVLLRETQALSKGRPDCISKESA